MLAEAGEEVPAGVEVARRLFGQQGEVGGSAERLQGAGSAQRRMRGAVEELEALDQELDVREAARAELQVPGAVLRRHPLGLDAPLHGAEPGVRFL